MLHFPCAAGVGSVVEVGTACRHGSTQLAPSLIDRTQPTEREREPTMHSERILKGMSIIMRFLQFEQCSDLF